MKIKLLTSVMAAAVMAAGCASEAHEHHNHSQAKLQAEAKISKEAATRTALAQVPNSTVREAELEREHGKLIWSFDMVTPDTSEITEVNVDAISGNVIGTSKESPEGESKEKD